ncbi:Protein of unknown function [Cotesia congregata]|uniref:Uncharacterized protein n=1 Tax=Cotesia congregata TaxID=51543 RepID=A0A8J2HGF8_COTCN|nr:Protein of unknown function [Cotesia congregata]
MCESFIRLKDKERLKTVHGDSQVYGPNTPIYHIEPDRTGKYITVRRQDNVLTSHGSKYSKGDALQPKMLLVYDYWDFITYGQEKCIEKAKKTVKFINSYYEELKSNPKIEVVLTGIAFITERQVYTRPSVFQVTEADFLKSHLLTEKYIIDDQLQTGDWRDFSLASKEVQRFSEWLSNNKDQFERLNYDFFLYSFPWYMADDATPDLQKHLVMSLSERKLCSANPGLLVNNLIGDEHPAYPVEISYLLGTTHPLDRHDSHYFTSNFEFFDDVKEKWQQRTISVISNNSGNNAYFCIKDTTPDYDEYEDNNE